MSSYDCRRVVPSSGCHYISNCLSIGLLRRIAMLVRYQQCDKVKNLQECMVISVRKLGMELVIKF